MIIYTPHRQMLYDAMLEAKEFDNEEEMKEYIANNSEYFNIEDIIIDSEETKDDRIGWENIRKVCVTRYGDEDYIKLYGCPQCIGHCATNYDKDVWDLNKDEYSY